MNDETVHSTWSTYGSRWSYNTLISLLRYIPLKAVYWFVYIFVIPMTLLLSPGARLAYRYYHKRRYLSGIKALWTTFLNHCIFAQTVIDKFAVYAGHKFTINHNGLDIQTMVSGVKPFLQLSAHVGCSEILGYSLPLAKRCNVLVYGGEKQALMKLRKTSFANMNIRMIPVGIGDTNVWEMIMEALDNGEIVYAYADRVVNKNKITVSDLYNHKVSLAKGPFLLAVVRGLDVVMVNTMKENNGTYSAYYTNLHYDKSLSYNQQIQQLADAYTAEIERMLDKYPLQWFNYFDL